MVADMDVWHVVSHNSSYKHVSVASNIKLPLYILAAVCLPVEYISVYPIRESI